MWGLWGCHTCWCSSCCWCWCTWQLRGLPRRGVCLSVLIYPWHHGSPHTLRYSDQTQQLSQDCSSRTTSSVDIIGVLPSLQCWTVTAVTIIKGRGASSVFCCDISASAQADFKAISRPEYTTPHTCLVNTAQLSLIVLSSVSVTAWSLTCLSDTW